MRLDIALVDRFRGELAFDDDICRSKTGVEVAEAELDEAEAAPGLLDLGLAHEQQHQELFLTDILHLFAQNPLKPAYRPPEPLSADRAPAPADGWASFVGGIRKTGAEVLLTYGIGPELAHVANGMSQLGWRVPMIGTMSGSGANFTLQFEVIIR